MGLGSRILIRNTAGKVDPSRLAKIFIRKLLRLFDAVAGFFLLLKLFWLID
jgi:hypothetical protein